MNHADAWLGGPKTWHVKLGHDNTELGDAAEPQQEGGGEGGGEVEMENALERGDGVEASPEIPENTTGACSLGDAAETQQEGGGEGGEEMERENALERRDGVEASPNFPENTTGACSRGCNAWDPGICMM